MRAVETQQLPDREIVISLFVEAHVRPYDSCIKPRPDDRSDWGGGSLERDELEICSHKKH